jgi:acyl-CoA synthetase (AMP-forming)/AMP-acid ligase II
MIIDWFDRGAELHADEPCLEDAAIRLRYREVRSASHRIAQAIRAAVGEHGRVALYSPNCVQAMLAALGTFRSGAIYVPLNARDAPDDAARFMRSAGCRLLFVHSTLISGISAIEDATPGSQVVVCLDRDLPQAPSLERWIAGCTGAADAVRRAPSDVAIIKATGGTTGRPKGVLQTHGMLETMYRTIADCMPLRPNPVHLVVAPITHAAGAFAFALMAQGARHVLLERSEPGAILDALEQERVSFVFLPPTAIYRLLAHPSGRQRDYGALQYLVYSAAPMSVDKLREALAVFGPVMAQCYGQAEAPMICTYLSPAEHADAAAGRGDGRLASAGRPTAAVELAIVGADDRPLPAAQSGEIVIRGDLVMTGYHDDPEASAAVRGGGWHHTGDVGYLDEDRYLYIVDRKRDVIITGGFNVYPGEVERTLWAHAAVQECAVIGVPDDDWGEAVKAVVELKAGASATESELIAWCRQRLGSVKTPKSVEFWPQLPRSAVGKVLKREIRARYWAGRTRQV